MRISNYLAIISLLLTLYAVKATAQSKQIVILQSETSNPLMGVYLKTSGGKGLAVSDDYGVIKLPDAIVPDSLYLLTSIGLKTVSILGKDLVSSGTWYMNPSVTTLNELSITGRRFTEQELSPITTLDIHTRPVINSQEVLRLIPGLFIGQHAGGGKAEQLFLRGFDVDHGTDVAISVDGMPVNMVSHAHGQGYADLHFVIPELIDRVSFTKGPYYAETGNFNTAGAVQFKTKQFLDQNFLKTEAGQFGTLRTVAGLNLLNEKQRQKGRNLVAATEISYSRGYFDAPQDFSRLNGLINYTDRLGAKNRLRILASGFSSQWDASGQIPLRSVNSGDIGFFGAIDPTEGGNTSRYNALIGIDTDLGNGQKISQQISYSRYAFELYSNFTFFLLDSVNGDQIRQKEARNLLSYKALYQKNYSISGVEMRTDAGIQIRGDQVLSNELSNTTNRSITRSRVQLGDINELNAGLHINHFAYLSSRLEACLGVRLDQFNNTYKDALQNSTQHASASQWSPSLRLNYKINPNSKIYVQAGQGFHSNDTRVVVQQRGREILPPARGADLGTQLKLGQFAYLQAALWYLWLGQEFVYVGDAGIVEPSGQTERKGVDLSLRLELSPGWFLDVDANYSHARALGQPSGKNRIPLAPVFTSIGGVTYRSKSGFGGSLRYRYFGDRPANEDNSTVAKGYFVSDLLLHYTKKRFELGVNIQNITNVKWKETQFETESRLRQETTPVSEIHFTPGTPFFARIYATLFF